MIVKNESRVISRALASVKRVIDYWVICDTGSSDNTKEVIREALHDIPGELHETPWVDFGHNRTLALQKARGKADYLLMMNADETLNIHAEFRHHLTEDAYLLGYDGKLEYYLPLLIKACNDWQFVGVTHEYLDAGKPFVRQKLSALSITHHADGGSRIEKYSRDIKLLENALKQEPENARYVFYLAQTYKDLGEHAKALPLFQKRTEMGGWEEEVWYAGYQLAVVQQLLKMDWQVVLDSYLAAYEYRPSRLEPIFQVAKHYRTTQQYHLGYLFSRLLPETPYPEDLLFIEKTVYDYELPTEYAICCYWVGKHEEAIRMNDQILATPGVPEVFLENARRNRQFSLDALGGKLPSAK